MDPEATRRALDHLQQLGLLTDTEHAAAVGNPELAAAMLRTPGEALAWTVAQEIVAQARLAALPARADAHRQDEAQAIVLEATDLISGEFPLPPWAQLHIRLLERRMQDGVSADALDRLLDMRLIDPAQHAHSLSMLPTNQEAWAAPDSLPATLAWTVHGSGALSEDDLEALEGRTPHGDLVTEALARLAAAPQVTHTSRSTSTSSSTTSSSTTTTFSSRTISFGGSPESLSPRSPSSQSLFPPAPASISSSPSSPSSPPSPSTQTHTRTVTWTTSATPGATPPGPWKWIGVAAAVLVVLYLVFA